LKEKMEKKMNSVIDKMEEIMERKEPKEEEKTAKIDEENIENLVRKIVFEAFDKSKVKPAVLETDDRDNLNALDAILENLFKESYAEDNEVEEKEPEVKKSVKPKKAEKEENVRETSETQQSAVVTDELIDEIVESIFPLVSSLSTGERDSDAEEIDDEVILIDKETGEEKEEEEDSLDVVHAALSAIIGDDPSEDQKLSPEVFAAVLELDEFLKEEEEERRQKEKKVDTLLSSALDFIDSAVGRREAAAARLGLNKRKKKKEKLDIEEVIAQLLKENN